MIWSPAADAPAEGQTARLRDAVGQLVSEPLLATVATDATVTVRPNGDGGTRVAIPALAFSPAEAVDLLTGLPDDGHAAAVGDSVRYWRALARYVVDRVRRQRFYPSAVRSGDEVLAVWRVPVAGHDEAARLEHFATAIPPVCLASCPGGIEPLTLVQSFVAEAADALVRRATSNDPFFARACSGPRAPESVPEVRWLRALLAPGRAVAGDLFENAALVDHVVRWTAPLDESGVGRSWRVALRLTEPEIPEVDEVVFRGAWRVEIELHPAEDDPLAPTAAADEDAELLTAADVWAGLRGRLGLFSRDVAAARTTLASGLRQAAGAVPPLAAAMAATPELTYLDLTTEDAYKFIRQWSPQLREFGLVVIVPEWAAEPEIRPGLVMSLRPVGLDEADEMGLHVVGGTGGDGRGPGDRFAVPGAMGLDSLVHFDWRVAVAGTEMSAAEFESLVSRQSPLVRRNGKWAVIDLEAATATAEALKREAAEAQQAITLGEAFRTAFGMSRAVDGRAPIVGLSGSGWLRDLLEQTPAARMAAVPQPAEFTGELRPYQLRGLGWLSFLDRLGIGGCLADDMGLGKAQPLDAKVLTPTGWTRMGDVQVGDRVVGSDGKPCRVTGVYPQGKRDVFRVTFSDGSGTECCDEHLWHVNTPVRRHRGLPGRVLPLAQIRQRLRDGTGNALHFVPLVQPVEFEPALTVPDGSRLPIAPYLLGALLGDGGIAHRVIISSADDDLLAHVVTLLPPGVTLKYTGHGVDYRIAGETPGRENPVTEALRRLELFGLHSHEKFVPTTYKFAPPDVRLETLRGLLDTDGHVRPADNNVEFCSTSPRLAEDVQFLVQSFGGTARIREKPTTARLAYRMSIALPPDVVPFRLGRKADVYRPRSKYPPARAIIDVEPVGEKACQCIAVDAPDHLYVTDDFIVTHNTIQLIALMLHERAQPPAQDGKRLGPTLLFAPTSVVGNWTRELQRFAPTLSVLIHHGPLREHGDVFAEKANAADVVLTSYALAHRDRDDFAKVRWHRVALDEAQKIKNPSAAATTAIRSLPAQRRVALTGTPVENHLSELWSIMDVLNPGLLGTAREFRERFAVPIERLADRDRSVQLRRAIRPFVLRRTKQDPDVAGELPEKMEMKVFCGLTPEQAAMYERVTADMLARIEAASGIGRRGLILAALTKLKQICDHPKLAAGATEDRGGLDDRSGKCERLVDMLEEVIEEGESALVFTQFREMGHLLEQLIRDRLKTPPLFLHGGTETKKRDEMVRAFQENTAENRVFILSLRAGGLGLNLTAASHVFHFDRWWNPAVEAQATDRAHRIGQTKKVQVHKFISIGTLEEKIDKMLMDKVRLADDVVGGGDAWLTELSIGELRDCLSLSADPATGG